MAPISFARGVPAPECLAVDELADCARAAIERDGPAVLSYGPGGGYAPLRDVDRGAARRRAEPRRHHERLAAGLRLPLRAARAARRAGDRRGADLRPADQDPPPPRRRDRRPADGRRGAAGRRARARARGGREARRSSTRSRPSRTRAAARSRRAPPPRRRARARARPPRARGRPVRARPLRGRGAAHDLRAGGWRQRRYASSFSKTVAPGVRVGYFVLPAELAAQIEALAVSTYISPPFLTQATVHEFIRRGNFEPNLERVRGLLRRASRRDARCARAAHARRRSVEPPEGGYFIWLDLDGGAGDLLARAEAAGVTFVQGHRLLRRRQRYEVAAPRIQLRLAGRDHRRGRAARGPSSRRAVAGAGALAARAGSRRRSRPRGRAGSARRATHSRSRRRSAGSRTCGSRARTRSHRRRAGRAAIRRA